MCHSQTGRGSISSQLSLLSLFPSLSVVSGIFQKDVPQISRTSFWVTIKMIHQTYKTCRRSYLFLHIWRSEPSCRHKQQQHQPVPTTGIMYALIIIPIQSSNLFGLSGELQFQRKNHEEWLVDKAPKLSQIIQFSPVFFPLIFSRAGKHKRVVYMCTSLSIPSSSSDNLQLIRIHISLLVCEFFAKAL